MTVFHAGEIQVQETVMGKEIAAKHRAGVSDFIRPFLPAQHSEFYAEAPWLITASVDTDSQWPRASVLFPPAPNNSTPLFAIGDNDRSFTLSKRGVMDGDRFMNNTSHKGAPVGILGIELSSRRRNRVNAVVSADAAKNNTDTIQLGVSQSFGNCPKYISARQITRRDPTDMERFSVETFKINGEVNSPTSTSTAYKTNLRDLFKNAETMFIATGNASKGLDVSHRGGHKGFAHLSEDGCTLKIPDYVGNGFFNTLGNITLEPRIGLLLLDFASASVTQIKGRAEIVYGKDPSLPGSERVILVHLIEATVIRGALPLCFEKESVASPFNPQPFTASIKGDELELLNTKQETHDTTTFSFRAPRPIYYKAGQYGTFLIRKVRNDREKVNENKSEENDTMWTRAWTISSAPRAGPFGEHDFSITVKHKQNGEVTSMMHNKETLKSLRFRLLAVEGRFIVPQSTVASSTIVLAVAGSGVTPAMAMSRFLSTNRDLVPHHVVLFYTAKTLDDVIFLNELVSMSENSSENINKSTSSFRVVLNLTQEQLAGPNGKSSAVPLTGATGQSGVVIVPGRLSAQSIEAVFGGVDSVNVKEIERVFVCGPSNFASHAESLFPNVAPAKFVTESFDY